MATIDGVGGPGPVRTGRRSGTAQGGPGFSVAAEQADAAADATPAAAVAPTVLEAMLGLQEMDPTAEHDRRARRHGQSVLAALAALQAALLGSPDRTESATLGHLAGLVATMPQAADPTLASVLSAVRLRAMVELARRGI
ncbi:MAG: flagellar assembly protein FliX [Acetobacteraceae bacterium]|nr:flagellar assembly protein FliX [Acetobacteraceae bacterium]